MKESEWFYSRGEERHGPISGTDLKVMAQNGELLPTDLIWREGLADWKKARQFVGLFNSAPPSPSADLPPALPPLPDAKADLGIGEGLPDLGKIPNMDSGLGKIAGVITPIGLDSLGIDGQSGVLDDIGAPSAFSKPRVMAASAGGDYAGFWKRFAALIIDRIIMYGLGMAVGLVVGFVYGFLYQPTTDDDLQTFTITIYVVGLLLEFLYFAGLECSPWQATVGKLAVGIQVTDLNGDRIGFLRSVARNLCKILSALILLIGYLMAAFTPQKQALHDLITGCLVVNRD